jgi:hypothetical protein
VALPLLLRQTPHLGQAGIAAAVAAIIGIPKGIFLVIILMVILRRIKLRGGENIGDDWLGKAAGSLELGLGCLSLPLLVIVVVEDCTAILRTAIAKLPVGCQRIDGRPERRQ